MKNTTMELQNLLSKSTVYAAIKSDVENECSRPSDNYSYSVYNYMTIVYKNKPSSSTDDLNHALAFDISNSDLISEMTLHFIKAWGDLCKHYRKLINDYPADEVAVIKAFNKIVCSIYIRKELDLNKHCRISEKKTVQQKDKVTGKSTETTKRVYTTFKPTFSPVSFDKDQTNTENSNDAVSLYECVPANSPTPEDWVISSHIVLEICMSLVPYPRYLLAFLSQFSGESKWDIIASLQKNETWTSIYETSLDQFCRKYCCPSIKSHLSGIYTEKVLAYTGSSSDIYKVLSTERNKAKKLVIGYILKYNIYFPSNPKYTYKK